MDLWVSLIMLLGLQPDDLKIYWIVEKVLIWAEVVRHADGLRFEEILQEGLKKIMLPLQWIYSNKPNQDRQSVVGIERKHLN